MHQKDICQTQSLAKPRLNFPKTY